MKPANKTVLVVGAGGFIGRHLVRELSKNGRNVIAISRHPTKPIHKNVRNIVVESGNPEHFTEHLNQCEAVIWLAWVSTPGSSAGKPLEELGSNLNPLFTLLQNMQHRRGCKLIYISSGGALYGDVTYGKAVEELPLRPKSYYGAAKAAAEHFISAWSHQFRRTAIIIRPSNVYGPGQTHRNGFGIIPTVFDKIKQGQPVVIWGDGTAVRDYLYIDDFSSLCIKALDNDLLNKTHVLNAASGEGITLNHLLDRIQEISGKEFDRIYERGRTIDVGRIVLNNSAAKKACLWIPRTSLKEGLDKTWSWYESSPE